MARKTTVQIAPCRIQDVSSIGNISCCWLVGALLYPVQRALRYRLPDANYIPMSQEVIWSYNSQIPSAPVNFISLDLLSWTSAGGATKSLFHVLNMDVLYRRYCVDRYTLPNQSINHEMSNTALEPNKLHLITLRFAVSSSHNVQSCINNLNEYFGECQITLCASMLFFDKQQSRT